MSEDFEASGAGQNEQAQAFESSQLLPVVRSRHGRPVRRVTLSPLFAQGSSRIGNFDDVVKNTVEFIKVNYADELGSLQYEIFDSPSLRPGASKVRRWAVKTDQMTIVIYRLPIERFGQHRRKTHFEFRMAVEFQVFSAAAELIGRSPDFFLSNG